MKKTLLFFLYFFCNTIAFAQLTYIGLKEEGNVRKTQDSLNVINSGAAKYWSKTKIIDDYLYVPTGKGLYRKNINTTLNDTIWQLYAFPDKPIRDFVKNGNNVLGITGYYSSANLLLKSANNGLTYTDVTPPAFLSPHYAGSMALQIAQNPNDLNTVLVLHLGFGIEKSTDFGNSWTHLNDFVGGYQDWYIGYNPNDTNNIMYTGEQINFESYIQATYNNGNSWQKVDSLQTHCTHGVAFHSTDKDIMISYGEGRISKSINQGITWIDKGFLPIYIYKILYDPNTPNILYATGDHHGSNNNIEIYRSIDGGENWHLSYSEILPDSDGVMDIQLKNDKLFIYTLQNGVYYLNTSLLKVNDLDLDSKFHIYPNPVNNVLTIESVYQLKEVAIYNLEGKLIKTLKTQNTKAQINTDYLAIGTYFLTITTEKGKVNKKIIKK